MKTIIPALALLFGLSANAAATVKGDCRLYDSKETVTLKDYDPAQNYGIFSVGVSSKGDRVFLITNHKNAITIYIQSVDGHAYSVIPLEKNGPTHIDFGIYLRPSADSSRTQAEWFNCDLEVTL